MATEINIQESVCLKKDEREENPLTSESYEEKVTELPGNKVKQLETSSLVAETVNMPLETGESTVESGIFFQALSVTMVIADEHSNAPESFKAAKQTEPEEETVENEENAIESEKAEVGSELFDSVAPSKKDDLNMLEKNQGDSYGVTSSQDAASEDIKEATTVADLKEQDLNETPRELVVEEIEDKSVDAHKAGEHREIGSKDTEEQKSEEIVKKIEQDEEIVEIRQNGLLQAITSNVETTEHEQKDEDVNVLEEDHDKDDITSVQEVTFEEDLKEKKHHSEDNEHQDAEAKGSIEEDTDVGVSTQSEVGKESIKNKEPDDGKAIEKAEFERGLEISDSVAPSPKETFKVLEKDQGDSDGVTSSQEAPCVVVEETTADQHATTVIDFKEQDLNEKPREFIEEENECKSLDAQEATKEIEKFEKKEETEVSVTADVFISAQTKSQVDKTEHEEEKSDSPLIKEICEETGSETVEYQKEVKDSATAIINKDEIEDEEEQKEQEVNALEKDEGEAGVTSAQDVAFEKDLHEKEYHNKDDEPEVVTAEERIEQQMQIDSIPSDCISKQTEPEEETTEKNDEEAIEKDDGQTNKPVTPIVKEIDEENVSEKTKSEEGLKLAVDSSMVPNENETVRGYDNHEKEQEIYVSEEGQSGGDDVTSLENASNKDIKETTIGQHETTVAYLETGQGLSATQREILVEEAKDKSVDAQEETEQHDDGANSEKEQNLEESVDETAHSYSSNEQEKYTEEIKPSVETIEEKDVCTSTQIESQEEATKNDENDTVSDATKENEEQQGLTHVIATDVSSSTQTEYTQKTTESEEKNNEETIKNDGGQTEKPESPLVEAACEATSSEVAESEEGEKHSESFSATLNENEALSKEEDLEKVEEIKTSEVRGGGDDVTSSQNASNEDIKETTIGQHDTTVTYVEEGQGVSATPKEIVIKEAEDKSVDAQEISLELGQPNEQYVEETNPCLGKTVSENPEDEIKKVDKELSHESVEDTNDNTTKEEKSTFEQEPVEEHSDKDYASKEKVIVLNETTEIEPQDDITRSTLFETSTKDTSNSEKEKVEGENLPIEDLETVSDVQTPEFVPKSEDSMLKEECFISETETYLDEEKETVTKEISSDEKTEVQGGGDDVTSSQNTFSEDIQETTIDQHDTTVAYIEKGVGVSQTSKEILIEEAEYKSIDAKEMPLEGVQSNEQNVEETHPLSKTISENPEDEIKKEDKDLFHESVEDTTDNTTKEETCATEDEVSKEEITDLNETTEVEPQEDITPSSSLETSTEATLNSEKEKAESDNLPIEDLETVSEVKPPEIVPQSEESVLKEACFISETETEKGTVTEEISSDEKTEQTTEIKQETVKEVYEETSLEKAEFEELKLSDSSTSSTVKINEKEITTFKDDDQEKDHEVSVSAESQGTDDITSSQNAEEKEDLRQKNYHNEGNEGDFIKSGEGVDEDTEEIKSSVEIKENIEHAITTNVCSSTQIQPNEEATENEEKIGEKAIENDDNEIVSREVNLEKKQEDVAETTMGEHATTIACFEEGLGTTTKDVTNKEVEDGNKSFVYQEETEQYDDGASDKRELKPEEHTDEIKTSVESNEEKDVCISAEDTSNSEKEKAESEKLPIEDLENVSEVQIPELVPKSEDSVLKEEFISETETHLDEEKKTIIEEISSDEKKEQTTEIKQETVKEICEETSSGKAELEERSKLTDSSDIEINEEVPTTFKDGKQEKDQEVNMSGESQGEDSITSSKNEVSEDKEDLQEKNYDYEGNERDFIKSREGVDEDTEEIKSSVETENAEHVITTNVCNSTQIEPIEDTTENEENNGEKAIYIEEKNDIVSREENLEKKQEDGSSTQTEPKEETICIEEKNEEAVENDDGQIYLEKQEKEQEFEISELQGGGDDGKSSTNTSNEDTKETVIGQHATTIVHFEEGLGVKAITKDIIGEEVEDKSIHAQEASEQCENGANDTTKQPPEEVNKPVYSGSETIEGSIKEEEEDAGNKEIKPEQEAENQADKTEDRSEIKDEVIFTENVSKELGQPEEQNVEEIQASLTETISEKTEDKITKDEDSSHDNVTKEETCFPDGTTKEIEISTLEHEPVEEQNDSQNEVSDRIFSDLNKTKAEVPQEDVTPSSSLGASTEDASNLDKAKAESEILTIEDLESVSEVHIPEVMPKSENSEKAAASVDEESVIVVKENSSDENLETHGSTQQPENSYRTTEENVTQLEQTGEINSTYENRDMKEEVTQESQLNSTEDSEMVKDVILTEEIEQVPLEIEKEKGINDFKEQIVEEDSYSPELKEETAQNQKEIVHELSNSDSIPVKQPEVDAQIGEAASQGKEEISCVSNVTNDRFDQEPTEEIIPFQVDLKNIESTAYPSESEKLATQALESDRDVQIPEVVADSEDSKVKEKCIVLATAEYTDGSNVEEQDIKTNEISSAPDTEQENVTIAPIKIDEAKSSDLIIEEKAITKEVEKSSSKPVVLLETKDSVENTEDPKLMADNLNVKDETFTVAKEPNEESVIIASEFEKVENTVTEENILKTDADKETVTLDEPQTDYSTKTTYDSKISSEVSEFTSEVAEIVPKCRDASVTDVEISEQRELSHYGSQKPSEDDTLLSHNDKNTEDPEVLWSVEKDVIEGVDKSFEEAPVTDVQKHEKDLDHETEVRIADVVSNAECSEVEPARLNTKEETSEFINKENQREQKKEADENIEAVIPVEDVKTSTWEPEVGSVDIEVPSVMDATADEANNKTIEVHEAGKELLKDDKHLESAYDQSKPEEEDSGIKQEPLELDTPESLGTETTEDLKISQKYVTDDLIKISQTHPEIQNYEVPASTVDKQSPNEPLPTDSSQEQGEPISKSLLPETATLKADEALGTEPQGSSTVFIDQKEKSVSVDPAMFKTAGVLHEPAKENSEVAENLIAERDSALTKDQQVEKEEAGESGVKTDEEGQEDEENEDDEKMGSCSDAPVMVEASKDIDVKVHKKSHNILSGVGSKVKHSIAKVKKAITGKSSPPKSPSPKANNQVTG